MTTRNWLTLIGGLCLAVGPQMQLNAPNPTLFWLGSIVGTIGGVLVGAKAFSTQGDVPAPQQPPVPLNADTLRFAAQQKPLTADQQKVVDAIMASLAPAPPVPLSVVAKQEATK